VVGTERLSRLHRRDDVHVDSTEGEGNWLGDPTPLILFDVVTQSPSDGVGHDVVGYTVEVLVGA